MRTSISLLLATIMWAGSSFAQSCAKCCRNWYFPVYMCNSLGDVTVQCENCDELSAQFPNDPNPGSHIISNDWAIGSGGIPVYYDFDEDITPLPNGLTDDQFKDALQQAIDQWNNLYSQCCGGPYLPFILEGPISSFDVTSPDRITIYFSTDAGDIPGVTDNPDNPNLWAYANTKLDDNLKKYPSYSEDYCGNPLVAGGAPALFDMAIYLNNVGGNKYAWTPFYQDQSTAPPDDVIHNDLINCA